MTAIHPKWKTAGLTLRREGTDVLEREIPVGPWSVPHRIELDVENDRLVWWLGGDPVLDDDTVLTEFLSLYGESNEKIVAYAKKWGVLGLCEQHDLPMTHHPPMARLAGMIPRNEGCGPRPLDQSSDSQWGPFIEPLEPWRRLIAKLRAMVDLEALMRVGEPGTSEQWHTALSYGDPEFPDFAKVERGHGDHWWLAAELRVLLQIGNVRPTVMWRGERGYSVELSGNGAPHLYGSGLFGALALHMAFSFAKSGDLAICSGCGRAFAAKESRAKPGEHRYCAQCRTNGTADRDRQRRYRATSRQRKSAAN